MVDGLCDARVAGRIASPFQDVAFDDECLGNLPFGGALRGGPDVDEHGTGGEFGVEILGG